MDFLTFPSLTISVFWVSFAESSSTCIPSNSFKCWLPSYHSTHTGFIIITRWKLLPSQIPPTGFQVMVVKAVCCLIVALEPPLLQGKAHLQQSPCICVFPVRILPVLEVAKLIPHCKRKQPLKPPGNKVEIHIWLRFSPTFPCMHSVAKTTGPFRTGCSLRKGTWQLQVHALRC